MTLEAVRNVHTAQPWTPFVLHLADGRSVRVTHPESLAIPPGEKGRTLVFFDPDGDLRLIDLLLVVEVQKLDGNGHRRRRAG